jgi:hypothetical protein
MDGGDDRVEVQLSRGNAYFPRRHMDCLASNTVESRRVKS